MRMTDEQRKMAEQNHNLIYGFLNNNNLDEEEYYGMAAIGLCKAVMSYDHKRGKLSTLANKCMKNEVIRYIKHINGKTKIPSKNIFSYDILLNEDDNESYIDIMLESDFNTHEIVDRSISIANFSKELTDRERFIVKCFESGLNQSDIARDLNVTPQAIYKSVKKIRSKWNKFTDR